MRSIFLASGAALLAASAANAGGYAAPVIEVEPVAPVVVAETPAWQGAYGGIALGYTFRSDDRVGADLYNNGTFFRHGADLGRTDVKGPTLGLNLGYRWQRDNWVFGPELWIEGGNVKADDDIKYTATKGGQTMTLEGNIESKVKNLVGLQFKTGYLTNPQTMVYGTAGVVRGSFELTGTNPTVTDRETYSATGYSLGLGAERKIRDNLSVYAEWQYRNFGKTDVTLSDGAGNSAVTVATPEHHNIKVGVNFQF